MGSRKGSVNRLGSYDFLPFEVTFFFSLLEDPPLFLELI